MLKHENIRLFPDTCFLTGKYDRGMGLSRDFQVSNVGVKSQMQMVEQRHILRMLEKSLARELDLEKKLT